MMQVVIRRVADGEERTYHEDLPWDDASWSWWETGNMSCDCNRYLCFERAAGRHINCGDEDVECSEGKYQVLRFLLPDGTVISGPDA